MDKKISDLIGENAVLKNEVTELKTDQWEENFKTLDNLKNELSQNQKYQQQYKTSYTRLKRNQRQVVPF